MHTSINIADLFGKGILKMAHVDDEIPTIISKGDIVSSNSMRMKGKVLKIRPDRTALVEFILSQNREHMLRTTKLETLIMYDLVKMEKKR